MIGIFILDIGWVYTEDSYENFKALIESNSQFIGVYVNNILDEKNPKFQWFNKSHIISFYVKD